MFNYNINCNKNIWKPVIEFKCDVPSKTRFVY